MKPNGPLPRSVAYVRTSTEVALLKALSDPPGLVEGRGGRASGPLRRHG
jgi:hypothetical protein